ncbi:MAG: hypothetical protein L7W43_04600 [Rubripirellula sp.]|nr:hypothetical protein [Rhodopirellula sp.]MCH1438907.1 hypothetical protein [Rubripirellula sp.]OUX05519.1 MAG: hypothetical protein CBE00_10375 [Planctomycetaceae bacterium TMED240]
MLYDHRQSAPTYLLLLFIGVGTLAGSALTNVVVAQVAMYSSGALMLLLALCFRDLTVSDQGAELLIAFGPLTLFKRRLQYSELERVEQAKSTILDGWGIHVSPSGGWVWNLWGYDCVDVWYRQGRKIRIGTDDAVALTKFLETKIVPADKERQDSN